ncbi:ArsR family transcriptional regulator [Actibacterium mucosum KCTC 23349]|uniref:ArsR family transcriptional regulator n=1 Tax=Actibacterium mucosum KCTC 23349 TaxID=1454373 RepID=A0A037ZMV8_9RHOB|nr:metalloregulator ArsR/SmtB family transcription factor [Actibacterium mucosum]KAJ56960.1 ArsR family transcriptional regulator [Actibacterium mucosum KCTC 23349]
MESLGYENPRLDAIFGALSDPTRRAILARLAKGKASVNEIAEPFPISQPAISRHLKVLENAGLIAREVDEQRRLATIKGENLKAAAGWIDHFSQFWTTSFDQLDGLLAELQKDREDE